MANSKSDDRNVQSWVSSQNASDSQNCFTECKAKRVVNRISSFHSMRCSLPSRLNSDHGARKQAVRIHAWMRWSGEVQSVVSSAHDAILPRLLLRLFGLCSIGSGRNVTFLLGLLDLPVAVCLPLLDISLGEGDGGGGASKHGSRVRTSDGPNWCTGMC